MRNREQSESFNFRERQRRGEDDSEYGAGGGRSGGGGHLQAQGQEGGPQEEEHLRGQGSQVHTKVLQTPHLLLSLQRFYLVSIIQYPFNNKIDIAMNLVDILYR